MSATTTIDAGSPDAPAILVFDWTNRTHARWRLALMVGLALLAHAVSFYILQAAYTPSGTLLPPPARVMLVPLDEPGNEALAPWLKLADPTLATLSPAPPAAAVLDSLGFGYVPSYDTMPPDFKPLEPMTATEAIAAPPKPLPPGPVPTSETFPVRPAAAPGPRGQARVPSRVVFDGSVRAYVPEPLPPVRFGGGSAGKPMEPTVYLVGLRPEGGPPFLFPMRQALANSASTNADEADEFARDYLARLPYLIVGTPEAGAVWGHATFYWSNEAGVAAR